ncbi:MAG: hypothetical protein ACOYL6_03350 [Bacteriovoracaceae bacterium]
MKSILNIILALTISLYAASPRLQAAEWGREELTEKARQQSYNSQKSFEKLFEARRNVSRKVGALIPSFNLGVLLGSVGGITSGFFMPLQLIAPLIGFIYPSNWYGLKESKLAFEAEKRFYISSIANNINTTEVLYLETHKTVMAIELYEKIANDLDAVLKTIHSQDDVNPIPFTAYAKLDILNKRVGTELSLLKQLHWAQIQELGHAIGLSEEDRKSFVFKRLPNLNPEIKTIDYNKFKAKALDRAVEINGGEYLSLAAQYAIKKRKWEFLSPSPDHESGMGAGYKAQIDIAKSNKRTLDLELKEFKERFYTQIDQVFQEQALLKDIVSRAIDIQGSSLRYYSLAKAKITFSNAAEFKDLAEATMEYMQATAELLDSRHQILAQESSYRRLLFQGKAYEKLIPTLWMKSPEDKLSKEEKKENKRINKAIKKGEVVLPANEFVESSPNA